MFTGLIRATGELVNRKKDIITVSIKTNLQLFEDLKEKDSVAVNGVCLTVIEKKETEFNLFISEETLKISTLGILKIGSVLNLERPIKLSDRLDGHIVQGHVDGTGIVEDIFKTGSSYTLVIRNPPEIDKYIVFKGSVCIDGISLTVAKKMKNLFHVAIIPETYENTNIRYLHSQDKVNIETDILGRYIESLLNGVKK